MAPGSVGEHALPLRLLRSAFFTFFLYINNIYSTLRRVPRHSSTHRALVPINAAVLDEGGEGGGGREHTEGASSRTPPLLGKVGPVSHAVAACRL